MTNTQWLTILTHARDSRTGVTLCDSFTDVDNPDGAMQSEWIRVYGRYLEHKLRIVRKFDCQLELEPDKLMDYDYDKLFAALKVVPLGKCCVCRLLFSWYCWC